MPKIQRIMIAEITEFMPAVSHIRGKRKDPFRLRMPPPEETRGPVDPRIPAAQAMLEGSYSLMSKE